MAEELPPLRVFDNAASPNVAPSFEIAVSGGTITRPAPGRVLIRVDSGAGGGAGAVYAATGNQYLTLTAAADLTAERILTVGTGLQLINLGANDSAILAMITPVSVSSGGTSTTTFTAFGFLYGSGGSAIQALAALNSGELVVGSAPTAAPRALATGSDGQVLLTSGGALTRLTWLTTGNLGQVLPTRAINTTYPVAGGGDLSADRTATVDTAFLVTSARTISAGAGLSGGGNLGADRTISLATPVAVSSGGTGASTFTAFGILFGSGGSAIQATSAPNLGQLMVGSGLNRAPIVINSGTTGQYLISSGGTVGNLVWVNSAAAGGASKTVRIPLALATVFVNSGNTFWSAKSGAQVDQGYVAFVDSGVGVATYWTHIPSNLASTPAWGLEVYHAADAGSGGNVILTINARVNTAGTTIDSTTTNLLSVGTLAVNTLGVLTVSTITATNFDATLGLVTNGLLHIIIQRQGGNAADTLSAQWNLHNVALRTDVT